MKKEDLENKLKISDNTCIHCPTLELAKRVLNIFHQLGLRWSSGTQYITQTNWDSYKENTVYRPVKGEYSDLEFAQTECYKIINAEEFIALHTEGEEFDLENYVPKGALKGFPKEIIAKMIDSQEEQENERDVTVFEKIVSAGQCNKGFTWDKTKEGNTFWLNIIYNKKFNLFFEKYPKKDNSQDFRVDDLENYIPKGELEGFPKEIISRMLDCQEEQGNPRDISVFEKRRDTAWGDKGFLWESAKEGFSFWNKVIRYKNFDLFFEKYPKKQEYQGLETAKYTQVDNNVILSDTTYTQSSVKIEINTTEESSQEFRVGDKVIYYITNKIGIVARIIKHKFENKIDIVVNFGINDICEYEISSDIERPFLLHYREDYDYSVIDFNNLPKRQEPKKWRAEKGRLYYCVRFDAEGWSFADEIRDIHGYNDNANYNSGNYFRTEIEAEIIAQKLNEYFKQLIQEEHGQ